MNANAVAEKISILRSLSAEFHTFPPEIARSMLELLLERSLENQGKLNRKLMNLAYPETQREDDPLSFYEIAIVTFAMQFLARLPAEVLGSALASVVEDLEAMYSPNAQFNLH